MEFQINKNFKTTSTLNLYQTRYIKQELSLYNNNNVGATSLRRSIS